MPMANFHSLRIEDPDDFIKGSFRTKIVKPGVELILAKKKDSDSMELQAVHFDKEKYQEEDVRDFIKKYKVKDYEKIEPARESHYLLYQ